MNTGNSAKHIFDKLVELGALDRFVANVKLQYRFNIAKGRPVDAWLVWDETPEGRQYWKEINAKITISSSISTAQFLQYVHEREQENLVSTYEYW